MDSFTCVVKLVEHAAWPVTVVLTCLMFRKSIKSLLDRLNKVQLKGAALELSGNIQKSTSRTEGDLNTSIAHAVPYDPRGLLSRFEENISSHLKELNIESDSEKAEVLSKHLANVQLINEYLETNRLIYGSQLELLVALKFHESPVENEFLITFYERASQQYPDCYISYSFEGYINFLKVRGLVSMKNNKYLITYLGQDFLAYLEKSGIAINRPY